ncbi:MAG: hypothetical protein Q9163_005797 [Psora crenata]
MAGANIFVIYASASGTNVTLSPRLGRGQVEPLFDAAAQVSLLEGSGIADGKMTANVRCAQCNQWDGGRMDFTSSTTRWIWAVKDGAPLRDDSQSADIHRHDDNDEFTLDLTRARGGNSLNPFVAVVATPSDTVTSAAPGTTGGYIPTASGSEGGGSSRTIHRATVAHGTIMSLAFVIIYPLGAIMIRLLSFKSLVSVHASIQLFAYIMVLAGMGLGIYIAIEPDNEVNKYHPVIGLVAVCLLVFQPIFGYIHHRTYLREHRHTLWATVHVWFGRILVTLGIINGGLGLRLADNTENGDIAYGVVAGVIWVTWMVVAVWGRSKQGNAVPGMVAGKSLASPVGDSGEEEAKPA